MNGTAAPALQLLDTTLRDGSYVVDFQFTADDTSLIAAALDDCGVHFVEVGHGLGLGASADPGMAAACTDEEYMRAADGAVHRGRWGMFFIPGIGNVTDIELAHEHGMGFIRVGTNVTEVDGAEAYITRAKQLGMFVSANFMKTYAATPSAVGEYAKRAAEYGADIVCVVDSAGGMFPEDVTAYVEEIRRHTDVPLGFHGHNNLGLVTANTLRAVELGASVVDTSMRGLGRSAGNAATEILLLALRRRGVELGIDPLRIMTIAEQRIDPILRSYPQIDSIGIVSGYAQFHSSFLGTISEYAQRYSVDARELILHVAQEDKVNAPEHLVERLARELAGRRRVPRRVHVSTGASSGSEARPTDLRTAAAAAARQARVLARKYGKATVFNLVQAFRPRADTAVSATVADGPQYVIASAEVATAADASAIVSSVDGVVEFVLLDVDQKTDASAAIVAAAETAATRSRILRYSDLSTWARSVVATVLERLGAEAGRTGVYVSGDNMLAGHCRAELALRGRNALDQEARAAIVCQAAPDQTLEALDRLRLVVDALIGALTPAVIAALADRGVEVFRPDMRAATHAEVAAAIGTATLVREEQGTDAVEGVPVAAGGKLAPHGTVIVDSVRMPTRVFGVADGGGLLLSDAQLTGDLRERLQVVTRAISATMFE